MSKNIKSFAAFLEQTERKAEKAHPSHAESAPDMEFVPGADSASHTKIVPHADTAPRVEITPDEDSASDVKTPSEPVRKVRDAETVPRAETASVRGHLR